MNLFAENFPSRHSDNLDRAFGLVDSSLDLRTRFDIIPSYPHIPRSNLNPWQEPDINFSHRRSMIHLRTRDFSTIDQLQEFLEQQPNKTGKNSYALLVFGDLVEDPVASEFQPREAISVAKKYFAKVGIVVNPTPIIRTTKEELESFSLKLAESPDFIVTQCVYNVGAVQKFFKSAGVSLNEICMSFGYWNNNLPQLKLGISNPDKLILPPQQLMDLAINECQGIYFCGNTPGAETLLQKQIEYSLK